MDKQIKVTSQIEINAVKNILLENKYKLWYNCNIDNKTFTQCNYIAISKDTKTFSLYHWKKWDYEEITLNDLLSLYKKTTKIKGQSKSKNTLVELLTAGPGTKLKFINLQGTSPIIYTFIRLDYQNNEPIMICECEEYGKCIRYLSDMGLIPYKGDTKTFWNPSNGIEIVA